MPQAIPLPIRKLTNDERPLPPFSNLLNHDLKGHPVHPGVRFDVSLSTESLYFSGQYAGQPWAEPTDHPSFKRFLWEKDVVEMFISVPGESRYLEINLSPYGDWWTGHLESHRKEETSTPPPENVRTWSKTSENEWECGIAIPLAYLKKYYQFGEKTPANVTCIVGGEARHHMSWLPMDLEPPDFHRTDLFPPVQWIERPV